MEVNEMIRAPMFLKALVVALGLSALISSPSNAVADTVTNSVYAVAATESDGSCSFCYWSPSTCPSQSEVDLVCALNGAPFCFSGGWCEGSDPTYCGSPSYVRIECW